MPISAGLRDAQKHAESVTYLEFDAGELSGNNPNHPDYQNSSYLAQVEDVKLVRAVHGGTKAMRKAKKDYLPQGPHELDEEYDARLERNTLYPAFERTVDGLVGMMLRKDPILEGPDALIEHADNIDMAGRDFPSFVRDSLVDAMVDGHSWLLVEYPRVDTSQIASRADERAMGLRPYWINLTKSQVINWRYDMVGGKPVLTMLVYHTTRQESDGEFGDQVRDIIRVLIPGGFQEWELQKRDGQAKWVLIDEGTTSIDFIPAVPLYAGRSSHYESDPPLLQLAYLNIRHWQMQSDRDFTLKFAGSPMPVFFGTSLKGIEWGANRALFIEDPEATAMLLEASGSSLNEQRMELKDIEARMASLGLQMLVRETRAAETAEAKMLDKAESDSALSVIARQAEGSLNEAWRIHSEYMGSGEPVMVQVNRDYTNQPMDAPTLLALHQMVQAGDLPVEDLWSIMQRGEILPADYDFDLAREGLEPAEPPPLLPL